MKSRRRMATLVCVFLVFLTATTSMSFAGQDKIKIHNKTGIDFGVSFTLYNTDKSTLIGEFDSQGGFYQDKGNTAEDLAGDKNLLSADGTWYKVTLTKHGKGNGNDDGEATDQYWIESAALDQPTDPTDPPTTDPTDPPTTDPTDPPTTDPTDPPTTDPTDPPTTEPVDPPPTEPVDPPPVILPTDPVLPLPPDENLEDPDQEEEEVIKPSLPEDEHLEEDTSKPNLPKDEFLEEDKTTASNNPSLDADQPKTGDEQSLTGWIAILMASLAAIGIVIKKKEC